MRRTLVIYKGNSYVRLTDYPPELVTQVLRPFCRRNLFRYSKVPGDQPRTQKVIVSHVFARFNKEHTELRFAASLLDRFISFMEQCGYKKARIEVKEEKEIEPAKCNIEFSIPFKYKTPEQEAYCNHLINPDIPVTVHNGTTGSGKTVSTIKAMVDKGERVIITVLPRYEQIWVVALARFLKLEVDDILSLSNATAQEVVENFNEGKVNPKIVLLPLSKIERQLKLDKEEDYTGPTLEDMFEAMKCGVRVIDEAHESIYLVYSSLLYGNHKKTIILSATLKGDDQFINSMYDAIFPSECYLKKAEYVKYIHVVAYLHRMDLWKYRINTKGFGGYSHVKFEQGILKRKDVFESYYLMLKSAFEMYYMENYKDGQKFLWFFATIDFCEAFYKRFLVDYPEMDVILFNAKVSKKNPEAYLEHRGVVTTPGSCGTGKDIPKLFTVFSPIAVSSMQRNDQMVGRTRPVDEWWPGEDPIFVYFVCLDEPKQVEYHNKRKGIFDKKMKKFDLINSGFRV